MRTNEKNPPMHAPVVADALKAYLEALLAHEQERLFVRVEGFDDPVYEALLGSIDPEDADIAGRPVIVRTTGRLVGREGFAIEEGKTATWHRNHVPEGHALLLVFNEATSDAQSLKDVFPVTETRLTSEGLNHLVGAAFRDGYVLDPGEAELLGSFVKRFRARLAEPQLRSLTGFLCEVSALLSAGWPAEMAAAIAEALPALRMFRCREFAGHINTSRGDRLLAESYKAARLGEQLIEDRALTKYEGRLSTVVFQDERERGGLGPEEKRDALRAFLFEGEGDARALEIDWREASGVLSRKARKASPQQKLKDLAQDVKNALEDHGEGVTDLPEYGQEVVSSLAAGNHPDADDLERLGAEIQDKLGRPLTKRVRNLAGVKPRAATDFVAELTKLALEIVGSPRDKSAVGRRILRVSPVADQMRVGDVRMAEAAAAFRTLYGGVEALMPAVDFDLGKVWEAAEWHFDGSADREADREGGSGWDEEAKTLSIVFEVGLVSEVGPELRAELSWEYPSDGPASATLENVESLAARSARRPLIPVYEDRDGSGSFDDLDLGKHRRSFGRWYDDPIDLKELFLDTVRPRPGARREAISAVAEAIDALSLKVAAFMAEAKEKGLLAADVGGLVDAYDGLLGEAARCLTNDEEAAHGFGTINRAWTVRPRATEGWALVTLLHPLKLLWWRNRAVLFGEFIEVRSGSGRVDDMVDDKTFGRELERMYSSFGLPAVLGLPVEDVFEFYLPAEEREGYELYRFAGNARTRGTWARNVGFAAADDGAAQEAARQISSVIADYVQTYPFVKDGMEIHLVECRNGLLPGRLVEQLDGRGIGARLSVLVHTVDRGAEIFREVEDWLAGNERFQERPAESYFPRVTLRVVEGEDQGQALDGVEAKDLVVLADVLSVDGQAVEGEAGEETTDVPKDGFITFPRSRPAPFARGAKRRRLRLNPPPQPAVVRRFYNAQYASRYEKPVSDAHSVRMLLNSSLKERRGLLQKLHEQFNWVVCYDAVADRFLLRHTVPGEVQVIRYSQGLGAAGRHNLTVSSASRTEEVVGRRLASSLGEMFPAISDARLRKLSGRLVREANELSGDIVLRAAGPGAYLNELIGMVLGKHLTELRHRRDHPHALTAWIYLDDYRVWFGSGKRPDLAFVSMSLGADGRPRLGVEVAETKCVASNNLEQEAADAERQVAQGLHRLVPSTLR